MDTGRNGQHAHGEVTRSRTGADLTTGGRRRTRILAGKLAGMAGRALLSYSSVNKNGC